MALENISNRELPYSTEAEKAVLGGIMLKNETWDVVSDLVKEDDFHKEQSIQRLPCDRFHYFWKEWL